MLSFMQSAVFFASLFDSFDVREETFHAFFPSTCRCLPRDTYFHVTEFSVVNIFTLFFSLFLLTASSPQSRDSFSLFLCS